MRVSSIKYCWSKFSARIRDYLDVVDSNYRPDDDDKNSNSNTNTNSNANTIRTASQLTSPSTRSSRHHSHKSDRRSNSAARDKRHSAASHKSNHCHYHYQNTNTNQQQISPQDHPIQVSRSQLPPGYRKRTTTQGQVCFVDTNNKTHWYDPSVPRELHEASLNLDLLVGKLSSVWEVKRTPNGKTYYVNHIEKTTQFTDPRLVSYKDHLMNILRRAQHSSPNQVGPNNRELFDKISFLRQELLKQQVMSHSCRIDISRKRIFEDSFKVVSQLQARDIKKRLLVKFRGEEGLDYGGVAREWFYLLSRELLNPAHGLFQYTSDDIYNLQINPDSGIVYRQHLSYMHFCGRILGMAVFHGHFIEGHFTIPFYKMLLRKPITLDDIEFVDPNLHRSLCWILENDITNIIDTTFLVQHNAFGQLQEHELKENGKNISVTEDNKIEYVNLYVNYRCRRGIRKQFEYLQRGFDELIPATLLESFDEHELELLIGGLSKIDVDDWQLNTKLKNCTTESALIKWFWDIVRLYGEDKRARLLQFVTGSPRVPIQGFKALQGVNSELRLFTIHLIKNACTDNLPKSHTCFNRLDLPPYETYEKLRDKLTQAIEETVGFAMQ